MHIDSKFFLRSISSIVMMLIALLASANNLVGACLIMLVYNFALEEVDNIAQVNVPTVINLFHVAMTALMLFTHMRVGVAIVAVIAELFALRFFKHNIHLTGHINTKQSMMFCIFRLYVICSFLCACLIYNKSRLIFSHVIIITCANDICAYLGGNFFKGPKLAPKISPGKTISGSVCGMCGAVIAGYLCEDSIWFSFSMGAFGQIGDLIQSLYKRRFNVKDSGTIIPGHGGVLDRIDGMLACFFGPIALSVLGSISIIFVLMCVMFINLFIHH